MDLKDIRESFRNADKRLYGRKLTEEEIDVIFNREFKHVIKEAIDNKDLIRHNFSIQLLHGQKLQSTLFYKTLVELTENMNRAIQNEWDYTYLQHLSSNLLSYFDLLWHTSEEILMSLLNTHETDLVKIINYSLSIKLNKSDSSDLEIAWEKLVMIAIFLKEEHTIPILDKLKKLIHLEAKEIEALHDNLEFDYRWK